MDATNARQYRRASVSDHYKRTAHDGLMFQEEYCLERVPVDRRQSVLDIGVGAGRTTAPLLQRFRSYVGIDYSDTLIASAKTTFPGVDFRHQDARHLTYDNEFDCALFSYNGIDYIPYADRDTALRGLWAALRPGGFLIYSTHNMGFHRCHDWLSRVLVKELFSSWDSLDRISKRLRLYRSQHVDVSGRYIAVNDPGLNYALITTYVDVPMELDRLRKIGFTVRTCIGNSQQSEKYDSNDAWVYILAEKSL